MDARAGFGYAEGQPKGFGKSTGDRLKDDVTRQDGPETEPRRTAVQRLGDRGRNIPWKNALSGRWWRRWFKISIYQSGRLSTFLFLILLLLVQLEDPAVLQLVRARVFDFYQQLKPRPLPENSPVIVIDIDEKSLAELGQWPWPRTVIGELVRQASEGGVAAIGFDVMFIEEDQTSISKVVGRVPDSVIDPVLREKLQNAPTNDQALAEAIKASGKVVLGENATPERVVYKGEPVKSSILTVGDDPTPFIDRSNAILRPLPILDQAAAGRGLVSLSQKYFDGIVRQVPMIASSDGAIHPSLSLEMLRVKVGGRTISVATDRALGGVKQVFTRNVRTKETMQVNTDSGGQMWVYFRPHSSFQKSYISATDIVNGRIPKAELEGKLAVVGTSASGLFDLRSTPLDSVLPGVEVHANILENVIFNTQLTRPTSARAIEWASTFLIGLLMIIVTPMVGARIGVMTFMAVSGALVWYSWIAFDNRLELYDSTFPVAVALMFYSFLTYAGYAREEAQRKQVRTAFGQYLSPALVHKLAEDPSKLALGGENREMTFMFSDVRGFTSISELFDAQGLTRLINRLLTPLTNAILSTNGTIDKYMGDCVMAFWNAPLDVKDHGASACRAAMKMIDAVEQVNISLAAEAKQEGREHRPLAVGIGINSGIACVGNMGSEQRFDYSVLGDNVNLASRLEGQSKSYGVTIVIGENTAKQVPEFAVLEMDLIKVKGKSEAVRIFTLAGATTAATSSWFKELRALHDSALVNYRTQKWDSSEADITACEKIVAGQAGLAADLNGFYEVLRERIADFRANPPPANWDGVYVATSK